MTLQRTRPNDRGAAPWSEPVPAGAGLHGARRRSVRGWLADHPAWPISTLLIAWPLWWMLGMEDYILVLFAIPMLLRMRTWRASGRPIRKPPGYMLWLLFLLIVALSLSTIALTAPDTLQTPVSNRLISYTVRALQYVAATVLLLYAGNLTEDELPRRRLAWMLGLVAIYATVGGLAGTAAPHVSFTSPLAVIIPKHLQQNNLLAALMHPSFAEIQNIVGGVPGRPDAPFTYTNEWGNSLGLLLPWLIVGWWVYGTRRQRTIALATLVLVLVPIVHSLDRGLWLALLVGIAYLALRFAARGRIALLGMLVGGIALAVLLVAVTPLGGIITQRLQHGNSDAVRTSNSLTALQDAESSPFVGYGDTRHEQGSVQSIAVGKSATCSSCGNVTIGGNGQLWMLLITTGFLGTGLYFGFFAFGIWRFRRDLTPYGLAGVGVLLLTFVYMLAYEANGAPLTFTMLAYALLWNNDKLLRTAQDPAAIPAGPVRGRGPGQAQDPVSPRWPPETP